MEKKEKEMKVLSIIFTIIAALSGIILFFIFFEEIMTVLFLPIMFITFLVGALKNGAK